MKGVCVFGVYFVCLGVGVGADSEADSEVDRESEQSNLQTPKSFVDFDLSSNPIEQPFVSSVYILRVRVLPPSIDSKAPLFAPNVTAAAAAAAAASAAATVAVAEMLSDLSKL